MQGQGQQIWLMDLENLDSAGFPVATQLTGLTAAEGTNQFPNWGVIKATCGDEDDDDGDDDPEDQEPGKKLSARAGR